MKSKLTSYAEFLQLPKGWVATRFASGVELVKGDLITWMPNPYKPESDQWWIKEAKRHIEEKTIIGDRPKAKDVFKY